MNGGRESNYGIKGVVNNIKYRLVREERRSFQNTFIDPLPDQK